MEVRANEPVKKKSSNDVMRKKLEAELRATEEIARIKQNVIEKRLAVELASLETEPPDGAKAVEGPKVPATALPKPVPKPVPKPLPKLVPPLVVAEPRKIRTLKKPPVQGPEKEKVEEEATNSAFAGEKLQKSPFSLRYRRSSDKCPKSSIITPSSRTFSRRHQLPEFFTPYHPEDSGNEEEEEEEEEAEDEESQPRRKGSFFLKGVIQKWRKKMRPEDRERE